MAGWGTIGRGVALLGWAVWVGGFTFYGAAVIPALHEDLDHFQAGEITRRVTDRLNVAGAVTLALWWALAGAERRAGPESARRTRAAALATSSALWLALIVLHRVMDRRLDAGTLRGFYPLHRAYLILSTAQWFANVGVLAASLVIWSGESRAGRAGEGPPEPG